MHPISVCGSSTGQAIPTYDAFGVENGLTVNSSFEEVRDVVCGSAFAASTAMSRASVADIEAVKQWTRRAETLLFDPDGRYAATLVANQAIDFKKQDGVTEIEESLHAGLIEQRLNDLLLEDEQRGNVVVDRSAAIVCAVQNFSHFLDLSRKVLRNIEVGVPVVVLSRSTTGQHVYRWASALCEALAEVDGDEATRQRVLSLVNYANCDIEVQKRLFLEVFKDASPVYLTGSRPAAVAVKALAPRSFASCGGPNTMILAADAALEVGAFVAAARDSAFIENSGQCTALRHVVAPGAHLLQPTDLERRLLGPPKGGTDDPIPAMAGIDALEAGKFSALLTDAHTFSAVRASVPGYASLADELRGEGYSIVGDAEAAAGVPLLAARDAKDRVAWRVSARASPEPDWTLKEHWRSVVLDVTSPPSRAALMDDANVANLAAWILHAQPIAVVVNKDAVSDPEALSFARRLWERTACVVFGIGDAASPARTAQARPQDGEIFGEVPPRHSLDAHTAGVVCVPSSTPSYSSGYSDDYLKGLNSDQTVFDHAPPSVRAVVAACDSPSTRGFCLEIARYLADAAVGPRRGVPDAQRDLLWGLQRPPLGANGATWLRISASDTFESAAPAIVAFVATNAASQLRISVHPANTDAIEKLSTAIGPALLDDAFVTRRTDADFALEVQSSDPWNVIRAADFDCGARYGPKGQYSLAGHFIARLFPVGHVKSECDASTRSQLRQKIALLQVLSQTILPFAICSCRPRSGSRRSSEAVRDGPLGLFVVVHCACKHNLRVPNWRRAELSCASHGPKASEPIPETRIEQSGQVCVPTGRDPQQSRAGGHCE